MAVSIGPFQRIVGVGWDSGPPPGPTTVYVALELNITEMTGWPWDYAYPEYQYTQEELCHVEEQGDPNASYFFQLVTSVTAKCRMLSDVLIPVYFGVDGGAASPYPDEGDGQGWFWVPSASGPIQYNKEIMTITKETPANTASGVGSFGSNGGPVNIAHNTGTPLDIPYPFFINSGQQFYDNTDLDLFIYLSNVEGGTTCFYYDSNYPQYPGFSGHRYISDNRFLLAKITELPINATWEGKSMTLAGVHVPDYYAYPGTEFERPVARWATLLYRAELEPAPTP